MTGAGGLVGAAVCEAAVAAGHEVVGVVGERPAPPGVEAHRVDVRDVTALGCDAVVHTAYRPGDRDVVVEGTRAVAALGLRTVHVSSDLVFAGREAPYTEDDEPDAAEGYGAWKREAEALVDGAVVRTSVVFGRPHGPQERLARTAGARFYEDEVRCPVHVDVLARALLALATTDDHVGPLHVAGPPRTRLQLARELGATDPVGVPSPPGRPKRVVLDCARARALGLLPDALSAP